MLMRHTKAQLFNNKPIITMPGKEEFTIFVDFTPKQKEYYDKLYKTAKERYVYDSYKATGNIGRGTLSILSSLHPARQACSGFIYSKDKIEEELAKAEAKTYRIQSMVNQNKNKNLSNKALFEMAAEEAFNDEDECPICYEVPMDAPLQTPCRHIFCGECIRSILMEKAECPMCRKSVMIRQLKQPPSKGGDANIIKNDKNQKEEKQMSS